jgi:hypothetical protein
MADRYLAKRYIISVGGLYFQIEVPTPIHGIVYLRQAM